MVYFLYDLWIHLLNMLAWNVELCDTLQWGTLQITYQLDGTNFLCLPNDIINTQHVCVSPVLWCAAQRCGVDVVRCALTCLCARATRPQYVLFVTHRHTARTHRTGAARTYGRYVCICNTLYDMYHCKRAPSHRAYILIIRYEPRIAYIWTYSMWRFCKTGNPVRNLPRSCPYALRTQKLRKAMITTTTTTKRTRKTISFGSG